MNVLALPTGGRRYLRIAQDLAAQIADGTFAVGERLPPERELSAQLQVSRTTVREALLALEIMRYVEIRLGAGVFVLPESGRDAGRGDLASMDAAGPWEVLEARRLIEGHAAFCAAQRIDEPTLLQLGETIDAMQAAIDDIPRFDAADAHFHYLIGEAAGNSIHASYISHLWKMRRSSMWEKWYGKTRNPANRHRSINDHRVIHRALQRRLPEAAQTAMQAHLDVLAERFFELNF